MGGKMKKLVILQLKGNSYAGVWHVNKKLATKLLDMGYDIDIISMRNNPGDLVDDYDSRLKVYAVNENKLWQFVRKNDLKQELKQLHFFKSCKLLIKAFGERIVLNQDYIRLRRMINKIDPDYILVSHYQILKGIPKKYFSKTIFHQHVAFKTTKEHKPTFETLYKYREKLKFLWLSKATMLDAKKAGFENSTYIYNPVRFKTDEIANVVNNKKIVTISRIDYEKQIDTMVDIINDVFSKEQFKDWTFEIYGTGNSKIIENLKKNIKYPDRMKLMGLTSNPMEVLLSSSITLNTSLYEGFALSIMEANECGVPTVSFNFGESVYEEIYNGETGFVIENRSNENFEKQLSELMADKKLLRKLSKNCKKFSKKFYIETIINEWINLFKEIDGD